MKVWNPPIQSESITGTSVGKTRLKEIFDLKNVIKGTFVVIRPMTIEIQLTKANAELLDKKLKEMRGGW